MPVFRNAWRSGWRKFPKPSLISHLNRNEKPAKPVAVRVSDNTLAEWTGLEPATPGVTGRYSNQLNYHSALEGAHCATGAVAAQ
jgi:hypothetical protein